MNSNNLTNLTIKELKQIEMELNAFNENFGAVVIFRTNDENYLITKQNENIKKCMKITDNVYDYVDFIYDNYIYRADNLDILKGWLYGVVQRNNGVI